MSEQVGEKTEQPTPRKLEEAFKRGQFAHSQEVQTVLVMMAGMLALMFTGREIGQHLVRSLVTLLGHLHDVPLSVHLLQGYAIGGTWVLIQCVGPVVGAAMIGGLLAGAIQNRFHTSSEALTPDWERVNPVSGLKRIFSMRSAAPTAMAIVKLVIIIALSYSVVKDLLNDPIFSSSVSAARVAQFLADASIRIMLRVGGVLVLIAIADYGYQSWRSHRDLMMTRQELKEEMKHSEANPQVRAKMRRRRTHFTFNRMLAEVPKADVVVTNPTHLAIALRYDRKTMRAPRVVAKGARWNALRIREVACQHQVPIVENKPLARMIFKYGRAGAEIPTQLYAAVAEVLAWVYRVNRYRYYAEQNQV